MDSFVSAINLSENHHLTERRPGKIFHPSVWGDFFLAYEDLEIFPEEVKLEWKQLKEEIAMILRKTSDQSSLKLGMIDNIQRLGLSYQFEDEINASLLNIYEMHHHHHEADQEEEEEENLHTVALRFRLLRHQGHSVSSEILRKFQDNKGKWDADDVRGMLSLYEASNYMVHGENILDEALIFTETALKCMLSNSSGFVANQIKHALHWPIRKTVNRVATRLYISLYQQDESHDEVLLKLAKLDFNAMQRMHKRELCALTKWWKRIDGVRNFPWAKHRMVEHYYIALGLYFEPQYSKGRMILTKQLVLTLTMDDAYDEYATIDRNWKIRSDERVLFTDAIQSWNIDTVNHLPSYMRPLYQAILDLYTEIEEELAKYDMSKQIEYWKQEMKKAAKAYYEEAYWCDNNYVPTMEEYMKTALNSSLGCLVATSSFLGMANLFTEEVLNWAKCEPLIIRGASAITRLMDDVQDHEDGDRKAGAVKCYMSQYGVSKKKAVDELQKQITNAWKDMNSEYLLPSTAQPTILERVLNIGRIIHTLFKDDIDGYEKTNSSTKQIITSVLVDPIND